MESRQAGAQLSRTFWSLAAFTVAWWTFAPGAYFLLAGEVSWGTLLTAVGLAALAVGVSRPILLRFEARAVHRPLALLFAVMVIVTALLELWLALSFASASPFSPALLALHAVLLLLGGFAIAWQLRQAPSAT